MDLVDLFPAGDFRFHLALRRGEPADFFRPGDPAGRVRAERVRWLRAEPTRYAALQPDGVPLLEEFTSLAIAWGILPRETTLSEVSVEQLGMLLEPDVLLLSPDAHGEWRLRGGALCFPSGWALEEKLGQTLDSIHAVVPGLNPALASPMAQVLARLKPGVAYLRDNWGIAATDELNLHPRRGIPAPTLPVDLSALWLRVEYQALVALPRSGGIAFGLRIALHRLDLLVGTPAGVGLVRALGSMPPDLASYKRIEGVRAELIRLLG